MREDYIRTARAKGLIDRIVINRHALKNALLPVVTLIGIEFAFLIGGLVVTEQVFNLNGIGRLFVQSVQNQDYTLTQALVMLVVTVFVAHQSPRRPPLCVARSAHPLRLTGVTADVQRHTPRQRARRRRGRARAAAHHRSSTCCRSACASRSARSACCWC